MSENLRLVLDDVLSIDQCKELIHIHHSESVVGYREHFSVTMLQEIIRHGNFGYLVPLIRARETVVNLVESNLKAPACVMVEWTGISCWHTNSSIPQHYDSNRPYLKQRHYSVVVYLNDYGTDFQGGLFHFSKRGDKEDEIVVPKCGRMVIFSSGAENIHNVDEITSGERYTFTVWLTLDTDFQEDPNIISYLNVHLSLRQANPQPALEKRPAALIGKESDDTNTWDIIQYKKDKFGISLNNTNFLCSETVIPLDTNHLHDIIDLCSFYHWKTGDWRIFNLINKPTVHGPTTTFMQLVQLWKEYKAGLHAILLENIQLWKDTDIMYL